MKQLLNHSKISFLKREEKRKINKRIHPNKVRRFNMIYNAEKDGNIVGIVITMEFSNYYFILGKRFCGYIIQNLWTANNWNNYSRAPGTFILSLTNK